MFSLYEGIQAKVKTFTPCKGGHKILLLNFFKCFTLIWDLDFFLRPIYIVGTTHWAKHIPIVGFGFGVLDKTNLNPCYFLHVGFNYLVCWNPFSIANKEHLKTSLI